jgi:pimeloyl-ACP methyl ester carboxylesterase
MLRAGSRSWQTLRLLDIGAIPSTSHLSIGQSSRLEHNRSFSTTTTRRKASPSSFAANTPPAFPCLDANEARTARLLAQQGPAIDDATEDDGTADGPEPLYSKVVSGYKIYHHSDSFLLDYGGTLNEEKTNTILLHTGLSASSHAASHPDNTTPGWWEAFIGPGKPLDTNKYFIICTNVLGSCYGSTGPYSKHPLDPEGAPYATRFPIVSIFDMVRAQFLMLDSLGIQTLHASLGSSMGGMQSVAAAHLYPDRVQRLVSISGCARSAPASIALRFAQRSGE